MISTKYNTAQENAQPFQWFGVLVKGKKKKK